MSSTYDFFSISGINALPRFGLNQDVKPQSPVKPISKSIAVYVHIPYCKTICQFCMLRKGAKAVHEIPDSFVEVLINEFSLYVGTLQNVNISTIYFGGGTPSMLHPSQFEKILEELYKLFSFEEDLEITFEGEAVSLKNMDLLLALKQNKVNRISFGVQTFDEQMRSLLGRTDAVTDLYDLKNKLDHVGFEEINIDYLYNLPNTDLKFLSEDLRKLKSFSPTSIDCHPLKYISCSTFMLRQIVENKMSIPDAKLRIAMFQTIREWAINNNYAEHFADQYSKNSFLTTNTYMKHLYGMNGGEYIGFGPGARSHYGDFGHTNIQNMDVYSNHINEGNKPLEKMIHAPLNDNFITCFPKRNSALSIKDIEFSTNPVYFKNKLEGLVKQGYLILKDDNYSLLKSGLDWYQNLQEELLSEYQSLKHKETIHSRVNKLKDFNGYFNNLGGIL